MNTQELIQNIANFCKEETPRLIAELQKKRFENQGAFNDNKKWDDNDPYIDHEATKIGGKLYPNKGVQQDKGRNEPLVDSGNLKSSLTNPSNWDLKPRLGKGKLTLSIPEEEGFTDSKYDKLQTGLKHAPPYVSPRGNAIWFNRDVEIPARNFKKLSDTDIKWIHNELVKAIRKKYT